MKKLSLLILIFPILIMISCKKDEGVGGTGSITGKIKINVYNQNYTVLQASYYAKAEDVYIIYGDETNFSDDVETNYDGTFTFEYLRKGAYKIYIYSEDSAEVFPRTDNPVFVNAEITKNGETVDLGEINILQSIEWNEGTSVITGKIYAYNWNAELTTYLGEFYAPDEDVFLMIDGDSFYIDDVKTGWDGTYRFENVPIGNYKVYAYSKDRTFSPYEPDLFPKYRDAQITENYQIVTLDTISIIK